MEHVGGISEREWNNYGGMYSSSTNEEADFMAQLLGNCSLPNENPSSSSFLAACWPVHGPTMEMASIEVTSTYSSNKSDDNHHNDVTNNMFYYFSQSSSYGGDNKMHPRTDEPCVFEDGHKRGDINLMENGDDLSNDSMEYIDDEKKDDDYQNGLLGINLQLGMERQLLPLPDSSSADEKFICPKDNLSKKRPPTHGYVQKNKRSVRPKKNHRAALPSDDNNGDKENDNINNNSPILQRQNSTMSYCSEDESIANSVEVNGGGISTSSSTSKSGKTRASRGSATDPQSLYARKRREKINERLRILQNLVPNGTKVDISTMLDEAVQYVKFLQLQIKLLSSDDLWMYSPIAYNGMDMGLDLKIASHNL